MSSFAAPAPPGEGITWQELNGCLLLIEVIHLETGIKTTFGDSDAVRANVVELDGPGAGTVHSNTLIFPKVLQSQLAPRVGQKVLGRLGQGTAKPGQSPPWMLTEANAADQALATRWINSQQTAAAAPAPPQSQEVPF